MVIPIYPGCGGAARMSGDALPRLPVAEEPLPHLQAEEVEQDAAPRRNPLLSPVCISHPPWPKPKHFSIRTTRHWAAFPLRSAL
jgi:hypothetical protein